MMIKGDNPENIEVGSTLSTDEFAGKRFDFMLSNPPYGKSWASEVKYIKDGAELIDANLMFRKLRKNLGDKNCEFAPEHIAQIT